MALNDNTYSRFVAVAKVALPLFALGVLSTVFLVAKPIDPSKAIPYAEVDVEELAREKGMTSPEYAGITRDGAAIIVTADTAKPDQARGNKLVHTEQLYATIDLKDGDQVNIESPIGVLNSVKEKANLTGGVILRNSQGYTVRSQMMDASLTDATVETQTPVTADGPLGNLSAGKMKLSFVKEKYLLVFQNDVKVIYDPKG
ncbi:MULTISPECIES: LPS export ABC transporter periplasmic protein LptC [Halocynthiibacter]|uniref:LPS export ABC transporter periplasmic protein LptC n=1 Tax=Halocynthiibacter halioticoli TaxID=2986804 RepID=A0AAE3J470_9RHOB|nr:MULTISPECIES: LPS export ABC transporter periplasmic protein LptC [Halocynthiibacter]MCV6825542.1 LPS export ABC transporter periplasmic protein LptC [Halocynthiibacter halioticoli]MCW4058543.1 LPS export ABC transporter periplasmic protein LptC [Halocynthiibacter sp. SDUM655004]MDE0590933.1 LPS export ABC transporter periplasmic protein LptC [Halocynthiibacter sp. C4]